MAIVSNQLFEVFGINLGVSKWNFEVKAYSFFEICRLVVSRLSASEF